jgi:hypothetical protein
MLPVEVNLDAYKLAKQNDLSAIVYHDLMMDNIDEVTDVRLKALKGIEKDKTRVARAYNKKGQEQIFPSRRISVENHTTYWIEEQSVWQTVT